MSNGPGQAVDHCLLVFVNVSVRMRNSMGVEVGVVMMIVLMRHNNFLLSGDFPDYTLF
jgi:hypothetical protein